MSCNLLYKDLSMLYVRKETVYFYMDRKTEIVCKVIKSEVTYAKFKRFIYNFAFQKDIK